MDGISYTWDANGNLLHDGVRTYAYDHANRLTSVSGPTYTTSYRYNGLGDRLEETVNGVTTRFTLDLAAGLTQALSDGSYTYLYGAGRIAQYGANGPEYFLGDALDSVRQLVDGSGMVVLAKSYVPYGEVLSKNGSGESEYGFTGEWTISHPGELIYLRARWYATSQGRFLTQDNFRGFTFRPASLHRYGYAYNNPLKYQDPSGHIICKYCTNSAEIYDLFMQFIGRTFVYDDTRADNVGELMVLAYFQEPSATITGEALNDIANDINLLDRQNTYVERVMADPRYSNEAFRVDFGTSPLTFGEMGNNNMLEDATHSQTWTVRAANVTANADISSSGDMNFNYSVDDVLDLVPDWGGRTGLSGTCYNIVTTITGAVWHGLLGARAMETHASWTNRVEVK